MKLPPDITLEVTAKCNFACPFCYCVWHESTAPPPKDMSADEWQKILDLCAEHKVKSVTFSGGEALLRKDLPELITYAKEVLPQAVLGVFTNNSRMTEEFFFFCKENKVLLSTSLQGLQSYGMMTGTKRKYHRTLKLLTFAAENDWRFSVSLTATQANKHEFADMFCACAVSGVSHISMGPVMVQGRGIAESARMAADFTCDCIRFSMNCPDHRWYGVDYEPMLPELVRRTMGWKP